MHWEKTNPINLKSIPFIFINQDKNQKMFLFVYYFFLIYLLCIYYLFILFIDPNYFVLKILQYIWIKRKNYRVILQYTLKKNLIIE